MRITKYKMELTDDKRSMLVKENGVNYHTDTKEFDTPKKIVQMMNDIYKVSTQAEEFLYMLAFDTKNHLLGTFEVSHGTVNTTIGNTRGIFVRALLCNAAGIIMIHNHPSGDCTPSFEDMTLTRNVREAGKIIGIPLFDHIIIGNGYFSFKEHEEIV